MAEHMPDQSPASAMQIKCLASEEPSHTHLPRNSYRSLQWSADGTCLITTTHDYAIETIVVPVDLLDERDEPQILKPYSSIPSPDPINAVTGYPFFDLQSPASTLILSSQRDHPIRFSSAMTGERVASYPLINPLTEAYISPHALIFSSDGSRFVAGSESLISVFDVATSGHEPVASTQTGPKKLKDDRWNPSTSIRGIVSALAIEPSSKVLGAGTFTRQIALYDLEGRGTSVGAFSVAGNDADLDIGGAGITQLSWSPCGRYLYISERKSDGIMLYDIRNTGQLLSWCRGRAARTNQRLSIDIAMPTENSYELWAGGTDGAVRMWKDAHLDQNAVCPTFTWDAHDDPITSTAIHRSGGVIATCASEDHFAKQEALHTPGQDLSETPTRLKIWSLVA